MAFCEHCQGQRFDRAQVLRALRAVRRQLRGARRRSADAALAMAIHAVRTLELPHLETDDDSPQGEWLH